MQEGRAARTSSRKERKSLCRIPDSASLLVGRKGEGREVSTAAQKQPDSCTDGDNNEYVTRASEL